MNDNQIAFDIAQPVSIWNKEIKFESKEIFSGLVKMALSGAVLDSKGVADNTIDLLKDMGLKNNPAQLAWLLIYQSLCQALTDLLKDYSNTNQTISDETLNTASVLMAEQLNQLNVTISPEFFERPQDLALLTDIQAALKTWLITLGFADNQANMIYARLKNKFVLALHNQWLSKASDYAIIKEQINTPFTHANRQLNSWYQYNAWLQDQINQRMFDEVFGLNQVYVDLRAYYQKKQDDENQLAHNSNNKRIVIDLKQHLTAWIQRVASSNKVNKEESIRIVSGGPGSGKSSFSKMFAAHIAELNIIKVLYIQLHHFNLSDDIESALDKFVKKDAFLKTINLHDEPKVLLIFDGLDELSMQGKAANETAIAFFNQLLNHFSYINNQNSQYIALLTGRDLAVQATQQYFKDTKQVFHVLPYFIEAEERRQYQDTEQLLDTDQRDDWWRKYALATNKSYSVMPEQLKIDNLIPITREPLLNYLVALSFERGKLDFAKQTTLNEIYDDLLKAVYNRQWDNHQHQGTGALTDKEFFRILEEIALTVWHGDGRTATVAQIQQRCKKSNLSKHLKCFQEGAEKGVTRLLTAFYFRESEQLQAGDKTFEFTHKSFGEYLTARRIVNAIKIINDELQRHEDNPDKGWNERQALEYWAKVCGKTAIDNYLFEFLKQEIALQPVADIKNWQKDFIILIESAVKYAMPMEKLGLDSFNTMLIQARNAEEALLAIHYACALQTEEVLTINWGSPTACGTWLKRLQGQRESGKNVLALGCLAYLNLSHCLFHLFDFYGANFYKSNLTNSKFQLANLLDANLSRANLLDANLSNASLSNANLFRADISRANLSYANLNDIILSHQQMEEIKQRFPSARFNN